MNNQNEKNYLIHYGNKNSGRYPRGSGENPHQHDGLKKQKSPDDKRLLKGAKIGAAIGGVPGGAFGGFLGWNVSGGLFSQAAPLGSRIVTTLAAAGMFAFEPALIGGVLGITGAAIVNKILKHKGKKDDE